MSDVPLNNLTRREQLLLMAARLHGAEPGSEIRANCGKVLRQGLSWAGLWNRQLESDTRKDIENPVITDWYQTLIALTRRVPESELLLEGQGNLGTPVDPPAFPTYTGCRLTTKGRELTEQLFAKHPECRA